MSKITQKITPFLWFDNQAEEAAQFYTSIFKNSKIERVLHYLEAGQEIHGRQAGTAMTVNFQLEGQEFTALNGGPAFTFTEAISFVVSCESQDEVDYFWGRLSEGGEKGHCGWLKDKFGLSWQIVPAVLDELFSSGDAGKSNRVMNAMLQMHKLDIAALQQAGEG